MASGPDPIAERRAELARRLAAMSPAKRALFERAGAAPSASPARETISPRAPGAPVPMSFAQELLWLLDRANPGMHGYNVPRVVRLRGALDVDALQHALDTVVARHEILRTTFDLVDEEPRQIVHAPAPVAIARIDLRELTPAEREPRAVGIIRDVVRRPFDLAADPQLRVTLVVLGDDDHVLVLESHHVASDAWSRTILLREIAAVYGASRSGTEAELSPLRIQYGDFAAWQRATLRGERLDALIGYWRDRLGGAPDLLDLPTDRPRPAVPSFEGGTRTRMLPPALLDRLRALSQAHGTTLFMTLLAAFDVLLSRYSGQDDIVVGSPIAGRANAEVEGVIGYFANTLVLRTRLDGDPTFAELLERTRETALGAYEHQDVPYEKLVLELQQERASGRTGLLQVMFTLQDATLRPLALDGIESQPFGDSRGAAKFEIALFMHEQPTGLRAAIEYRADLFDASTVDRMLHHLEVILEQVVDHPTRRISAITLVSAEERAALLHEWNDTAAPFPSEATLHGLIAAQASATPDAIAVECDDASGAVARMTFAELDAAAERVARRLRARGVRPGSGVGICAVRSPELVVGMLGALKAGAFYLPLDPEYPADRVAFMLQDAAVPVVLVGPGGADVVAASVADGGPIVLPIGVADDDVPAIARSADAHQPDATPSDLAYVIYTSGSTGRPKGVMIPHRAVVNYLAWMQSAFPLGAADAVLQKAPASFDACIWEFFLPLVTGARLVLARPGGHQDPAYLVEALERHGVTILQLVPSQLAMIVETPGFDATAGLPRLRRLFLGGEALPPELLGRLAAACPTLPVTNLYGPTEATVYTTFWSVDPGEWRGGVVPIGRPIANATVHVLDACGQLAPVGVPGELCIGGVGLAAGYLNRPELTAEKFVLDPLASGAGARLYRTGDRARRRPDGSLEYLGRMDTQVKLRGFRIELGEIESALAAQPEVQSAVAIVREDAVGDQRLVAYCIPASEGAARDSAALRTRLKGSLPDFMVPTAIVWLEAWPINANGKLDRKALPAPVDDGVPVERVAPRTAAEAAMAAIWSEVLKRTLGVTDDFFENGGHSLLALRVLSRVAQRMGVRLPLRAMFEAPTIAGLSSLVVASARDNDLDLTIPRRGAVEAPLTHGQEVLWLVQRAAPESTAYNVAEQWAVDGDVDAGALQRALVALVARHEVFRTRFVARDASAVQVVDPVPSVVLELQDVSGLAPDAREAAASRIAVDLARAPFDLEREHLLRATLVRLGGAAHRLIIGTHHIAFDGWSRAVVARDLSALYAAEVSSTPIGLAPLPIQFTDFAAWERERLAGEGLRGSLDFWTRHLEGASPVVTLPEDRPRTADLAPDGARATVLLPVEILRGAASVAQRNDATLFMVLFAALQALLHRYGNVDDTLTATVVAGRDLPETEPLVGYFANTLAYRTSFEGVVTFRDLLERVRETQLEASDHAAVPFEMVSAAAGLAEPPRVMFVLQNNAAGALRLGDASMRTSGVDTRTAKFDLFLSMGETPDGLRASLQYRTGLFEEWTARRILRHLETLLAAIGRDDAAPIAELPLLDSVEREQVLSGWNDRVLEVDASATLASLLREQAARTPDALALVDEHGSRTYAELHARSDRLAVHLAGLGVRPGTFVGVCMQRSVDLIVALVAVIKAGGAYVPLDPEYPAERVAFMLDDTGAPVVITEQRILERMPELAAVAPGSGIARRAIVRLDTDWPHIEAALRPINAVEPTPPAPDDVAYVIYTSGSTGRPKGVLIEHRNVVAFLAWARTVFSPAELAGVLASTSVCFDLSVFEIFAPLVTGGAAIVTPNVLSLADAGVAARIAARRPVSLINTVPSAVTELLAAAAIPSSVTTINLAGELLQQRLVDALYAVPTVERIYDLYGPSEDTTYSTFTLRTRGGRATIGVPIANTRAYVLDAHGQPVPVGIPGELYLAGAGVARGYLNRPELTAERFARDPFATEGVDARMYRTGDLVRRLSSGELEYLGRMDHQVKLRGFRIELGEVEEAAAALPGVGRAIAAVRDVAPGDPRLVCYYVTDGTSAPDGVALRTALRRRLPHYMVPSAFVRLEAFPLTQNGKIDRKALPTPALDARDRAPFVAPRTSAETQLAEIWRDALRVERIGVRDNFFDLGGHSLVAMRIVSRVQQAFGVRLPLNAVLEHPTIEQLVALVQPDAMARPGTSGGIRRATRVATRRSTATGTAPVAPPPEVVP